MKKICFSIFLICTSSLSFSMPYNRPYLSIENKMITPFINAVKRLTPSSQFSSILNQFIVRALEFQGSEYDLLEQVSEAPNFYFERIENGYNLYVHDVRDISIMKQILSDLEVNELRNKVVDANFRSEYQIRSFDIIAHGNDRPNLRQIFFDLLRNFLKELIWFENCR